jgi:site-specific recombinase XerD
MVARALSPRTQALYAKVLERAGYDGRGFGDLSNWPESSRKLLRAAVIAAKAREGDVEAGRTLAAQIEPRFAVKKQPRYLTEAEVKAFETAVDSMPPRLRPLLRLLLRLGLRSEELLGLSREAVVAGIRYGTLTFTRKGGKEQSLPAEHVKDVLSELLKVPPALPRRIEARAEAEQDRNRKWQVVGEILAANPATYETRYNLLVRAVKRTAEFAGIEKSRISPHKLRHAFATDMIRRGAPLSVVQRALGHSQVTTTQRYVHADTSDVAKWMRQSGNITTTAQ